MAKRSLLDLALRLATLSALYGIVWSIVVAVKGAWAVLWWTLPALVIAWLLWRSAHQIAIGYAGLLRSAFDLHRFDVYENLHWPKPTAPETEKAHGVELTLYLLEGTGAKDIAYEHPEAQNKSDKAADHAAPQTMWGWVCRILRC